MNKLRLSHSDYDFYCKYADNPFFGFDIEDSSEGVILAYDKEKKDDAWLPFELAYDNAYLKHALKPDYDPDDIGLRLEKVFDKLIYQSHNQ